MYAIASITKIVTTTIIFILATEGKININFNLNKYIPKISEDEKLSKTIGNIYIMQLLTHTSGLISWFPFYTKSEDLYSILKSINCTTGSNEVMYSDLNFILLGEVIKTVTKLSLKEAVVHYIKESLNLKTLGYGPVHSSNVAPTEFGNQIEKQMCNDRGLSFDGWREEGVPIKGEVNDGNAFYYFNGQSGHAGIFSDKYDLAKIAQLYLNGGEVESDRLIRYDLVQTSMKEHCPTRGLGWQFSSIYPDGLGHTGFTGTTLFLIPNKKLVAVTLASRLHEKEPKFLNEFRQELHNSINNLF
jgi:CubicO group peptidase (beta-lactamase class C family)